MPASHRLLIFFPRLWQVGGLGATAYSVISAVAVLVACSQVATGLSTNYIPENILSGPAFFFSASVIATLFWIYWSSRHFRVGTLGYEIKPPRFVFIFFVFAGLWSAPVVGDYYVSQRLRQLATEEKAGAGYLRIQRIAALLNADIHYEPLKLNVGIQQLEPVNRFSAPFIKDLASSSISAVESFAPITLQSIVLTLLAEKIPECATKWPDVSSADAIAAIESSIASRLAKAASSEEKESLNADRASQITGTNSKYDSYNQQFRECLDRAIQGTRVRREDINAELKNAARNAYMIQAAHKSFGQASADFRQYSSAANFAVPDLLPLGIGDLTVVAAITWAVLLISISYIAAEYVELSTLSTVAINGFLGVLVLSLFVSLFNSLSLIPAVGGKPSIFDSLAAILHWPALAVLPVAAFAVLKALWILPSTYWSRFAMLTTFLGVPVALIVETLNAVNSLPSVNYQNANCSAVGVAERMHCYVYSIWQPIVRLAGQTIAQQFHWTDFWAAPAGRILIAALLATLFTWLALQPLGFLLKREFVRPRDK
jgi:hypothetical protein